MLVSFVREICALAYSYQVNVNGSRQRECFGNHGWMGGRLSVLGENHSVVTTTEGGAVNLGLHERVAIVTGSSQGIGRAVAQQFGLEGAHVAVTYRREEKRAEELAMGIRAKNGDAIALHLDLASFDSIESTVEVVLERWGRIDVLVNNAVEWGPRRIAEAPAFQELPPSEWQQLLRTNIEGPFRTIQAAVPPMREQQWGRIVNVSSIVAEDGLAGSAWYSTAKASLHGLTRTLSKELGPYGILINTVMPGLTITGRTQGIASTVRRRVEENSPIRRMLDPKDVANAIVFLCSVANSAITGEILRVSGGRL